MYLVTNMKMLILKKYLLQKYKNIIKVNETKLNLFIVITTSSFHYNRHILS